MTQDFRRDRGTWRYTFVHKGERQQKAGFATRKAAMMAEADHRKALAITWRDPSALDKITVNEYTELWMADHVKRELRPRTARLYRQSLDRHVLPTIGTTPLVDLTRAQLRALFANLSASGLAKNTLKNCLIPLRSMLNAAIEDGHLQINPATLLGKRLKDRARTEEEAAEVDAYTKSELDVILQTANDHDDLTQDEIDFIHLLAGSGLRLGEALGLQLDDIVDQYLKVRRNVQWQDREAHVLAPKNGKTRRVDITPALAERLMREGRPGPYLFGGKTPWRPEKVRRAWHKLLDGFWIVRRLRVHDLRHTYATRLLEAGAPPSYVKDQLGHSSIQVTIDIYGRSIPGANRRWVDETFGGAA